MMGAKAASAAARRYSSVLGKSPAKPPDVEAPEGHARQPQREPGRQLPPQFGEGGQLVARPVGGVALRARKARAAEGQPLPLPSVSSMKSWYAPSYSRGYSLCSSYPLRPSQLWAPGSKRNSPPSVLKPATCSCSVR